MEKKLIYLFFIYIVLEGALRKWLLPSFSSALFLVKDILILSAAVVYLVRLVVHRNSATQAFTNFESLLMWGWGLFFLGYIPVSGFSLTTFLGLRYYLIVLPIMLLLPHVVTNFVDLNRLSSYYLWLALAVALLGVAQFLSPPSAFINRYAWNAAKVTHIAVFGDHKARITGTFSYIAPYTAYLQFVFLMALAKLNLSEHGKSRILLGLLTALLFTNIVMSGSRAPFLSSVILSIPFLYSALKEMTTRKGQVITSLSALLVIGLFLFQFSDAFSMLSARNLEAKDSDSRIFGALLTPINAIREAELVGAGIGSTFQGVRESSGTKEEARFDEVGGDRIVVEVGIFGYLFVLLFKIVFLGKACALYWNTNDRTIKTWALVVFGYQLSFLWIMPVYNSVAAIFYFACLGLYATLRNQSQQHQQFQLVDRMVNQS